MEITTEPVYIKDANIKCYPDCGVIAFRANNNPLSNYYMCNINIGKWQFRSAEHAYQWEKCKHAKRHDLAQHVYETNTQLRENISLWPLKQTRTPQNGDNIKVRVMEYILHVKWYSCERFRQTLMSTGHDCDRINTGHILGGRCCTQSCAKNQNGKVSKENQLGKVLHRIRTQVEQLTAIDNSSHDSIVLDMPALLSELLSSIDTSTSSPVEPTCVRMPPPPPLAQATTSLPPEVTSQSLSLPLVAVTHSCHQRRGRQVLVVILLLLHHIMLQKQQKLIEEMRYHSQCYIYYGLITLLTQAFTTRTLTTFFSYIL